MESRAAVRGSGEVDSKYVPAVFEPRLCGAFPRYFPRRPRTLKRGWRGWVPAHFVDASPVIFRAREALDTSPARQMQCLGRGEGRLYDHHQRGRSCSFRQAVQHHQFAHKSSRSCRMCTLAT